MIISPNIPLDVEQILDEIARRQQASWNNGRINDREDFPTLQQLFEIMNSGIPTEDFFYEGDLFRLHSAHGGLFEYVDPKRDRIIGTPCEDGSCCLLPFTEYSERLVAFSKSPDFTDRQVYYKVFPSETAILIHENTRAFYGIDVNAFLKRFGAENQYMEENEVLFPLQEKFVVKEYQGTPNKFKYYFRNFKK